MLAYSKLVIPWSLIDWWNKHLQLIEIRKERQLARAREIQIAKERMRRENTGAAFDRKILGKRGLL
jgi:hypothetical protein